MKFILTILLVAFSATQVLPALQSFSAQKKGVVLNQCDENKTEKEKEEKKSGKEKCLNNAPHLHYITANVVSFFDTYHSQIPAPHLEYQSPPPDKC